MTKDQFFETIQSYCLVELPFTYWYPLNRIKENIPVIAYDLDKIYTDNQIEEIEKVLKDCSINDLVCIGAQVVAGIIGAL